MESAHDYVWVEVNGRRITFLLLHFSKGEQNWEMREVGHRPIRLMYREMAAPWDSEASNLPELVYNRVVLGSVGFLLLADGGPVSDEVLRAFNAYRLECSRHEERFALSDPEGYGPYDSQSPPWLSQRVPVRTALFDPAAGWQAI